VAEIVANSVLPAIREDIEILTADGLTLVGELATPVDRELTGLIICVHPLPTAGGMMDSHVLRKAAWRLPALTGLAILRFNTRGTTSARGTSEGEYDNGHAEGLDLEAAIAWAGERGLPDPWLLGWSFGTDVILRHGNIAPVIGAVLLSPPLRFSAVTDLKSWAESGRPVVAIVPELDDYLRPAEATERFAVIPQARVIAVDGAKHLWVGDKYVRIALNEIVSAVLATDIALPTEFDGPMERWSNI
jgi:alpha/beta superfamily hydrolase